MKKFIFTVYTFAVLAIVPAAIYGYLCEPQKKEKAPPEVKASENSSYDNETNGEVSIKLLSIVRGV